MEYEDRHKNNGRRGDVGDDTVQEGFAPRRLSSLCPRLFTIYLNPIAWTLKATEGYRLSKPINTKVTYLLYIDDPKAFAASATKLNTVLRATRGKMKDIGLDWNPKKCSVVHVKKGAKVEDAEGMKVDGSSVIKCLKEGSQYKFLGVLESSRQEDQLAFRVASEVYLDRLSVIWSSPLSDYHRIVASNQYALPALTYPMWTQHLSVTERQRIDREARKIIVENGGKHPLGSTALCYLARERGGRGLRSAKEEYKAIKIKSALKLYKNTDPTMNLVRRSEERSGALGHNSLIKEATHFSSSLGLELNLNYPTPSCCTEEGEVVKYSKIKQKLRGTQQEMLKEQAGGGPKLAGEADRISMGGYRTRKRLLWLAKQVEDMPYICHCWRVQALRAVASYTSLLQQEYKNGAGD